MNFALSWDFWHEFFWDVNFVHCFSSISFGVLLNLMLWFTLHSPTFITWEVENNVGLLVVPRFLLFDIHILIMNYNCSIFAFYELSLISPSLCMIYPRYLNHTTHSMPFFLIFYPFGSDSYSSSDVSSIVWITLLYLLRFKRNNIQNYNFQFL
jgi:hypothetical protein